jgi:hypothetical protein
MPCAHGTVRRLTVEIFVTPISGEGVSTSHPGLEWIPLAPATAARCQTRNVLTRGGSSSTRSTAVRIGIRAIKSRIGIRAIREKPHRRFMHPRGEAIGCRPDLPVTNNGPEKCRLLGSAAEV